MSAGHPLNDDDRLPWLKLIRAHGEADARRAWENGDGRNPDQERAEGKLGRPAIVITCSALKKWYRDILRGDAEVPPGEHNHVSVASGRRPRAEAVVGMDGRAPTSSFRRRPRRSGNDVTFQNRSEPSGRRTTR